MKIQYSKWMGVALGLALWTAGAAQAEMRDVECYDLVSGQDLVLRVRDAGGQASLFSVRYQGFERLAPKMANPSGDLQMYRLLGLTGAILLVDPAVLAGNRGEIELLAPGGNATFSCD